MHHTRTSVLKTLDELGHSRTLLTNGDVDAVQLLGLVRTGGLVIDLLVQDGVERHGGFAGLAVADDQFALAAADGDESVQSL